MTKQRTVDVAAALETLILRDAKRGASLRWLVERYEVSMYQVRRIVGTGGTYAQTGRPANPVGPMVEGGEKVA